MRAVTEATTPLLDPNGNATGVRLRIAVLPRKDESSGAALWSSDSAAAPNGPADELELLEGMEYRYTWEEVRQDIVRLIAEPDEIFRVDALEGRSGRLRPGLATGTVRVMLRTDTEILGELELQVRSRKLHYLSEYRWMLRDIAERMTELVMNRFAVSDAKFGLDHTRDAVTLYQRFSFLRALFEGESFQSALREIIRRPHVAWETKGETVGPGAGMKADAQALRQFAKGGPRSPWPSGPIRSVPSRLTQKRTEATHDTTPNRFVKFCLEHWRQMLGDIDRRLAEAQSTPATTRGRREIADVISQLNDVLHHDVFAEAGRLTRFPSDDQVLQKREGYRDIYKAYVESEFAARLSWQFSDEAFGAGQRDIATLYEYWAFIQLAQVVADLIGQTFDMGPLVQARPDGLTVGLRAGVETVLVGVVDRFDRRMKVELCFNRTYRSGQGNIASWTMPMRPDYSLLISAAPGEPATFEPIAVHFDAKYRVEYARDIFGFKEEKISSFEPQVDLDRGGVLRADLLKMHAYRDAIHRTAGAYVLYPGGESEVSGLRYTKYQELLPGLGAFVLRPTDTGHASGAPALRRFISDVLDHVATRLTEFERSRYWMGHTFGGAHVASRTPVLSSPPPDATVLLGFVKSREHWDWIRARKTYNVRAEGRLGGVPCGSALLRSQLLLLYCPGMHEVGLARIVSDPEDVSSAAMAAMGYPHPRGNYLCVQLQWLERAHWVQGLSPSLIASHVESRGLPQGAPASALWGELWSFAGTEAPGRKDA